MPYFAAVFAALIALAASTCPFHLQSGDVTPSTAIVQASLQDPTCGTDNKLTSSAKVEVSTDPNFGTLVYNATIPTAAYAGIDPRLHPGAHVAKAFLSDLKPATKYYYRFTAPTFAVSPVGAFRTLTPNDYDGPFSFLHLSCANANPYPVASALQKAVDNLDPLYALFNGDVVYADRYWVSANETKFTENLKCCNQPIPTLEYYRALYADQRDARYTGPGFPEVLRSVATFSSWDDHGVNDNYAGQGNNPRRVADIVPAPNVSLPDVVPKHLIEAQYRFGQHAFFEQNGLTPGSTLSVVDPVPDLRLPEKRIFRKFKVGANVEVFILDLRQYRDTPVPEVGVLPILPKGVSAAELCDADANPYIAPVCGAIQQFFPDQEGFRTAEKTLLGPAQKAWLKKALTESTATFKVVVSSVQILEWYFLPSDRWEGYWKERQEIIDFIEQGNITNVTFLVGDVHASMFSRINPGRTPAIHEFTTGPVGASTFADDVGQLAFPVTKFIEKYGSNAHLLRNGEEKPIKFVSLGVPNFMTVSYANKTLTIRAIDSDGRVVTDPLGNIGEFVLEAEDIGLPVKTP